MNFIFLNNRNKNYDLKKILKKKKKEKKTEKQEKCI